MRAFADGFRWRVLQVDWRVLLVTHFGSKLS